MTNVSAAVTTSGLVYFNRTWDDGYDDSKGFISVGGKHAVKTENNGNRYWSVRATEENATTKGVCLNAYMQLTPDTKSNGDTCLVFEFDFMVPSTTQSLAGPVIVNKDENNQFTHGSGNNSILNAATSGGNIQLYSGGVKVLDVVKDTWAHIVLLVDYSTHEVCPIVNGTNYGYGSVNVSGSTSPYTGQFRFNVQPGNPVNTEACVDNLSIYAGTAARNLHGDPGLLIDPAIRVTKQYVAMKTGSPRASAFGDVCDLVDGTVGAPFVSGDGTVYVPLGFLAGAFEKQITVNSETSMTVGTGKSAVTVTVGSSENLTSPALAKSGLVYVSQTDAADIFGVHTFYDSMGLILFSNDEIKLTREENLSDMLLIMNTFVLDNDVDLTLLEDITSHLGGEDVHPRIGVTQARFDELRAVYEAKPGDEAYDEVLQSWIKKFVSSAESTRSNKFKYVSGTYQLKKPIYQPYFVYEDVNQDGALECVVGKAGTDMYGDECNGNGYDVGGRSRLSDFTSQLQTYGFAYQMTGDTSYADCFYAVAVELDKWEHWGEGHFLNCADGAVLYATGFDWLYHAFDNDGDGGTARREFIASSLFRKAIFPGWGQFRNVYTYVSPVIGNGGGNWSNKTNNWVTVCSSGIMTSILAIAEYGDLTRTWKDETYFSDEIMRETVDSIFLDLPDCFHAYAPDGSYPESPGYWGYGTNTLFLMIENLCSATGKDYGLMNVYGIDKTCDYAVNIESSDYLCWNYHDAGSASSMQTNHFFYGQWFGRNDLIALRYLQIQNGKGVSLPDVLYYCDGINSPIAEMSNDYYCEGIDTFVTRSSWEQGAIFTGLHGGPNTVSHGNTDTGNFVIYKGQKTWICDLGSDNYNVRSYYGNASYYRLSAEGANTIVLPSLEYGQERSGSAKTVKTGSNEHGSYSILDMSGVFGGKVSSAYRGLLFTGDRSTVVVQDEIYFTSSSEFYWFAHTPISIAMINVSEDGRTAYLRSNNETLRATIVSEDTGLTFSLMDCYSPVLNGTFTKEEAEAYSDATVANAGQREYNRAGYCKLAIHGRNKTMVNMAVVFEFVEFDFEAVKYEKQSMFTWDPASYTGSATVDVIEGLTAMVNSLNAATRPGAIMEQSSRLKTYLNNGKYAQYLTEDFVKTAQAALDDAKLRFEIYKEQAVIDREDSLPADAYEGLANLFRTDFSVSFARTGLGSAMRGTSEITAGPDGNRYFRMYNDSQASVENSYVYANIKMTDDICIEFDYSSMSKYPYFFLQLRYDTSEFDDSLNLSMDGTSVILNDASGNRAYVGGNILTVGEWTHFAVVYHPSTLKMDLYINDIAVAEGVVFDSAVPTPSLSVRFNFGGGINTGEFCLDNIRITSASVPLDVDRHLIRLEESIFSGTLSYKKLTEKIAYTKEVLEYAELQITDESLCDLSERLAALDFELSAYDNFANLIDLLSDAELDVGEQLDYLNELYTLVPDVSHLPAESDALLADYSELMEKINEKLGYTGALYTFTPGSNGKLGTVSLYLAVDDNPVSVKKTKSGVSILDKEKIETIGGKQYYVVTREIDSIDSGRSVKFFVDFKVGKKNRTKLIALSLEEYAQTVFASDEYSKGEKELTHRYLTLASDLLKNSGKDSSAFDAILEEYQNCAGVTASLGNTVFLPRKKEMQSA